MIATIVFFLLSVQLAVGLLVSLLLLSPRIPGERFFRFIGTLCLMLLVLAGLAYRVHGLKEAGNGSALYWRSHIDMATPWLAATAVITLAYILSLPFSKRLFSRVLLNASGSCGCVSLWLISHGLASRAIPVEIAGLIFPADFLLSSLALGAVMTCMVLGHWYLVEPGMSVRPLKVMAGLLIVAIAARVLLSGYTSLLAWKDLSASGLELTSGVLFVDLLFFGQRALFGLVLPLALSWMIWQTVKIRSTQSATGILYVAVVFVLFGEFLSRYILVSRGYPI